MIEVEMKFELPQQSREPLYAALANLPACQKSESSYQADRYYDTANFLCMQQSVFIRMRNAAHLEIKYHEQSDPTHLHSTEKVIPLRAQPEMIHDMNRLCARFMHHWQAATSVQEALEINHLQEFVCIEKRRTLYTVENLIFCIDHVTGLGDFLEIEIQCADSADLDQAQARLQQAIADLALPSLRSVPTGYVELWLQRHGLCNQITMGKKKPQKKNTAANEFNLDNLAGIGKGRS